MTFYRYFFLITGAFITLTAFAQYTFKGKVVEQKTKRAVEYAAVSIPELDSWTTTNSRGEFSFQDISLTKITLTVSCLGFEKYSVVIDDIVHTDQILVQLTEDNLLLNDVVVTAQKKKNESSSYTVDRKALNHIQANSVSDVLSQLPGGTTGKSTNLIAEQRIALRSTSVTEKDNATFATAVELDGIRLSNNSNYSSGIAGIDTRNISVSNIESVEVVSGLPSVEYGDLSAGLVKITTKKGKSPLELETNIKPLIKSYSLQKGFLLGKHGGTLNLAVEHTASIANRVSPYTTYKRNGFSVAYNTTLGTDANPLVLNYTLSANAGGYNSESDPDAFTGTYSRAGDNALRTGIRLTKTLHLPWISSVELFGSMNIADKKSETRSRVSSSSSMPVMLTTEEGYHIGELYSANPDAGILMIPAGYWYTVARNDEKPVNYSLQLKVRRNKRIDQWSNNLLLGAEWNAAGNYGHGESTGDKEYSHSYRPFVLSRQPFINSYALYLEDKMSFPVFGRLMHLQTGIRSDIVSIRKSAYGVVQALSPRVNLRYNIVEQNDHFIKNATVFAGVGDAIKLPSGSILFPRPVYADKLAFASGTLSDNSTFYAYYTQPDQLIYNPDLKWQRNRKTEAGFEMKTAVADVSVTVFYDKIFNPYKYASVFTPYEYKLTDMSALNSVAIDYENRSFSIDKNTGIVTVADKSGVMPSQQLAYNTRRLFKSSTMYTNGSPVQKWGVDWVINFKRIEALKTTVRVDGAFFNYKAIDQTMESNWASSSNMSDGNPYKYIGWYVGGAGSANGSESSRLTTNITFTTHIPVVRMIFTLRLETCLYDYTRNLSEYRDGARSFVLDNKADYTPSSTQSDIYAGNVFVGTYPLYYTTIDDMNTRVPFAEKFLWAKDNDPVLYNELAKMVLKSNYNYYFNKASYSPYYSANINLTKEIGDKVSVSFLANNFFNNMKQVRYSWNGNNLSLYRSGKIPPLYYGIALRIKL